MSIAPIGPISAVAPTPSIAATDATAATGASGANFATELTNGLNKVQELQANSDNLAVQASTGTLTDVSDYMVASTQAQLATQLTVAVRNKAVDAFNEIMRMQA